MLAMVLDRVNGVLQFVPENRDIPTPTADSSVMQIKAFGINHGELINELTNPTVPRVRGIEAVGTIYATAENSGFAIGQKVMTIMGGFGSTFDGGYEEYATVPNTVLYPLNIDMDWKRLATLPESFYTAYGSLKLLHLGAGKRLLIRGGSSSVGLAALMLAKSQGVIVTSTTRDPNKVADLKKLGADDVLLDNDTLKTDNEFDSLLELVGAKTLLDSVSHVSADGYSVLTGGLGGQWTLDNFSPFAINGYLTKFQSTIVNKDDVAAMSKLIQKGNLSLPIIDTFSLKQVSDAQDDVAKTSKMGKVVVLV
ncbi:zinc-binding dehydrogenase [Furfurilactobacillus cerevisiae]|uniref:zinc-binding dehydrogenase n=1 Tax=Furfurilactobacillus rossiae TaxID=231049 RepID=UPI003B980D4C